MNTLTLNSWIIESEPLCDPDTDQFFIYPCVPASGPATPHILFIGNVSAEDADPSICMECNVALDRAALALSNLAEYAKEAEVEHARGQKEKVQPLNLHFMFPGLAECFTPEGQGDRRVLVLSFASVAKTLDDLTPLSCIINEVGEPRRVDWRSSVWILGKLLKLLTFTHSVGISAGGISASNVLLNVHEHFVTVLDWTKTHSTQDIQSEEWKRILRDNDIRLAIGAVIESMGGNVDSGYIPNDPAVEGGRYANFLLQHYHSTGLLDAASLHQKFYALADDIWERAFYPFTTLSLR